MAITDGVLLSREAMVTGLPSVTKPEAIAYVGNMLVERGHVDASYVDAMLQREETVSTLLGNGVAMPHGTFESRDSVSSTGIVVAQFPEGIDWGAGVAHLVIGLAAVGDDHVNVLSHLAEVLQDEDVAEELWTTTDQEHLYRVLTAPGDDEDEEDGGPLQRSITISGEGGLHA
ncbi:MAG: PTS sugar transporter subunit IIA, partial [Acidimicrobiia bacterium]